MLISQPQSIWDAVIVQGATCRQFAHRGVGSVSGWPRLGGKELMCVLLLAGFLDPANPPSDINMGGKKYWKLCICAKTQKEDILPSVKNKNILCCAEKTYINTC